MVETVFRLLYCLMCNTLIKFCHKLTWDFVIVEKGLSINVSISSGGLVSEMFKDELSKIFYINIGHPNILSDIDTKLLLFKMDAYYEDIKAKC